MGQGTSPLWVGRATPCPLGEKWQHGAYDRDWRSDREKRELKSSLFLRFHRGVLRHPPMGALCFVTLFGVVGAKPLPLGEPRVLIRSVKTHTGLLLTKVTKQIIL